MIQYCKHKQLNSSQDFLTYESKIWHEWMVQDMPKMTLHYITRFIVSRECVSGQLIIGKRFWQASWTSQEDSPLPRGQEWSFHQQISQYFHTSIFKLLSSHLPCYTVPLSHNSPITHLPCHTFDLSHITSVTHLPGTHPLHIIPIKHLP